MRKNINSSKQAFFKNIRQDLPASIVVFLVALPLCLGISLASTSYGSQDDIEGFAGIVFPGIIAGIIGGIIVGAISGSRFGVSGPAAGLITIVSSAIISFGGFGNGGFEKFILAVAIAGVFQIIFGLIKGGAIAYYMPTSVIKGMLAGIGITIFLKELPHFFGYDKDPEGDLRFHQLDGHTTFSEIGYALEKVHWGATIVAIVSLIILVLWGMKFIKNHNILGMIPAPLLAILISIGLASFFLKGDLLVAGEHLVSIPTPGSLSEFKAQLFFPDFSALTDTRVYGVAIVIALVASIESLLCVEATDKMDPNKRHTPMNRELIAQGVGNIFSGLVGGLPITQVIVRSTANISSGAKTKYSAVMHGVFLFAFVLAIPGVLNMIPRATLAAVLLLIGFKLAHPKTIVGMVKAGISQWLPFFTVIVVMIASDLLKGVGSGLAVAFLIIIIRQFNFNLKKYKRAYLEIDIKNILEDDQKNENGFAIQLELSQHASFLNKIKIKRILDEIETGKDVIIDLSKVKKIDFDINETITDFITSAESRKIKVNIINPEVLKS
ncbi:MAG: SulP family inorganic anion transporter [Crocinitomicaceae bacterium]|nr:SulP family inorganic anion transporter [Crocinitomicaceae bacterium]